MALLAGLALEPMHLPPGTSVYGVDLTLVALVAFWVCVLAVAIVRHDSGEHGPSGDGHHGRAPKQIRERRDPDHGGGDALP